MAEIPKEHKAIRAERRWWKAMSHTGVHEAGNSFRDSSDPNFYLFCNSQDDSHLRFVKHVLQMMLLEILATWVHPQGILWWFRLHYILRSLGQESQDSTSVRGTNGCVYWICCVIHSRKSALLLVKENPDFLPLKGKVHLMLQWLG